MTEKNSFQAVLERSAKVEPLSPAPDKASIRRTRQYSSLEPNLSATVVGDEEKPKVVSRPSRKGTRLIAGHFEPRIAKQLKLLAVEEDTSQQALLEEALNDLFIKKGKRLLSGGSS